MCVCACVCACVCVCVWVGVGVCVCVIVDASIIYAYLLRCPSIFLYLRSLAPYYSGHSPSGIVVRFGTIDVEGEERSFTCLPQ